MRGSAAVSPLAWASVPKAPRNHAGRKLTNYCKKNGPSVFLSGHNPHKINPSATVLRPSIIPRSRNNSNALSIITKMSCP
ncbi:hypothetical protein NPIL_200531 [Nephila pilipes]|uniref:Uncharacterized protein n=1 Tax=Nephila pilipes TaxID=299642 RepID=A0A8X6PIX4_NEPPI|nr:hypothetical protein NPIL_200531 [Nephila pilipes]